MPTQDRLFDLDDLYSFTATARQTPYPMMRAVALINGRSHVILDAQLSPYRHNEMRSAADFIDRVPDHSITLFDKGFCSAELLLGVVAGVSYANG